MTATLTPPRLVRLQDQLARGDTGAIWRVNPRTGALDSRAGLSWTGVRPYRTAKGLIRVLRRPEQVNSPGHLRTLRLLPTTEGHPAGDVDVGPGNEQELKTGTTGEVITVETLAGYDRPVGNVSISRPATIAKMVDAETWAAYLETWPDAHSIYHDNAKPRTGTSLGYNALWYGPYIDAEIIGERDEGEGYVGAWQGPNGPEPYDVEHVIDPDCEIVQRLVVDQGFDPLMLGGNHFATALLELGGRGAEQSELMRIVDSRDVIGPAPTRVSVFVPLRFDRAHVVHGRAAASQDEVAPTPNTSPAGETPNMSEPTITAAQPTQLIEIGIGRDASNSLRARGISVPSIVRMAFDMAEAPKIREAVEGLADMVAEILKMLAAAEAGKGDAEGALEAKTAEMADMMSPEDAAKMVEEYKAKLAEAEMYLAEAKKTGDEAKVTGEAAQAVVDQLRAEIEPLRAAAFASMQDAVIAAGFDATVIKACKDAGELRRAVVVDQLGNGYAVGKATDAQVDASFEAVRIMLVKQAAAREAAGEKSRDEGTEDTDGNAETDSARDKVAVRSSFDGFPSIAAGIGRDEAGQPKTTRDGEDKKAAPVPTSTASQMLTGMSLLGGGN